MHQKEIVKALIRHGADVNHRQDDGATPLFYARADIGKILLQRGADIGVKGKSGHMSMDVETAQLLLDSSADINATTYHGSTPLHTYVYLGSDLVQLAIYNGANVNAVNDTGWTPLIYLARTEGATPEDNMGINQDSTNFNRCRSRY